jgi:ABC-type transport system substrate-binding protein
VLSLALCLVGGLTAPQVQAQAPRDRLVLGLPLEPPNLDPTSGAAAAVDEVVYANVFEGLTKLTQNGAVAPSFLRQRRLRLTPAPLSLIRPLSRAGPVSARTCFMRLFPSGPDAAP